MSHCETLMLDRETSMSHCDNYNVESRKTKIKCELNIESESRILAEI